MNSRIGCALAALLALPLVAAAEDPKPVHLVCSPKPLVCTSSARFDPLTQQLLVRKQLDDQPKGWSVIFLYVPVTDTRELEELQIRFLDELLKRESAPAK
jgi:hypothetical protein